MYQEQMVRLGKARRSYKNSSVKMKKQIFLEFPISPISSDSSFERGVTGS